MLGRMPDNEALTGTGLPGNGYGDVLWVPSPEVVERARVTDYRRWLAARGVSVGEPADYHRLWQWSVNEPGNVLGLPLGLLRRDSASAATGRCWRAARCPRQAGSPAPRSTTRATRCGPR